jgi:hypothetical protein
MACERFKQAIIEEAIGPGANTELDAHLANCADCRDELARQGELQARIMSGVEALVGDAPSPGLLARIRLQIAAEKAPHAFPWMRWATAGLAACAVLVILYAERPRGPVSQPEVQMVKSPAQAPLQDSPAALQNAQKTPAERLQVEAPRTVKPLQRAAPPRVVAFKPGPEGVLAAAAIKTPAQGPEVIVPAGQREAVLRLVKALQSGRVDAASLMQPAQTGDYALLKIAPIEVKPLVTEEVKEDPGKQGNH